MRPSQAPWNAPELEYGEGTLYEDPVTTDLWATQKQIAQFAQISVPMVYRHLTSTYACGDLNPALTSKQELIVGKEGDRDVTRQVTLYDFHAISAVMDKVSSQAAFEFKAWRAEVSQRALRDLRLKYDHEIEGHKASLEEMALLRQRDQDEFAERGAEFEEREEQFLVMAFENPNDARETKRVMYDFAFNKHHAFEYIDHAFECGLDPFTGQAMDSETVRIAERRIAVFHEACAAIRKGDFSKLPKIDESLQLSANTGRPSPFKLKKEVAALIKASPRYRAYLARIGKGPSVEDPAATPADVDRAERRLEREKLAMDEKARRRVVDTLVMTLRPFEKFWHLTVLDEDLPILVYDADRGADMRRHDLGADDARTLMDAGISKGLRYAISTDGEEIAADWRGWVARDDRRVASVIVHIDPDKTTRERRLAELARLFAADDEPLQ